MTKPGLISGQLSRWALIPALMTFLLGTQSAVASPAEWLHFGQDMTNSRNQDKEKKIGADNAHKLEPIWELYMPDVGGGDVWTTPAVDKKAVYFPDSVGNLFKLDRKTGEVIWQRNIAEYSSKPVFANNYSRTTPAISKKILVIGDQANRFPFYNNLDINQAIGAEVMAVDTETGDPLWTTIVDDHPFSIITTAATIYKDVVLVGVSSYESAFAAYISPLPGFPPETQPFLSPFYQPTSNGSMVALDLQTGAILWQRKMTTEEFSGASIWGSSPSIDKKRGQVFVGTGQNFSMPSDVQSCAKAAFLLHPGDQEAGAEEARACLDPYPENYFDSIVAFDIETGAINWSQGIVGYDVWHVACLFGIDFICPDPAGADADFGQSPIFFAINDDSKGKKGKKRDVIGVGQKSGDYWVLDAETGEIIWNTQVSPGGIAGGIQWGSAYDGERIYTSSANSDNVPWELTDGSVTDAGIWSALDPQTGEILWQTGAPTPEGTPGYKSGGAATIANGVMYVCSWDDEGSMYALDAENGDILWSFQNGGTCNSGAAVVDGMVYWGSGYQSFGSGTGSQYFRAFGIPKK